MNECTELGRGKEAVNVWVWVLQAGPQMNKGKLPRRAHLKAVHRQTAKVGQSNKVTEL